MQHSNRLLVTINNQRNHENEDLFYTLKTIPCTNKEHSVYKSYAEKHNYNYIDSRHSDDCQRGSL